MMMKTITLQSLTMTNFKGCASRTTHFNEGAATTIQGPNGSGKSRHMEAFLWLLFGKDSQDRKDFEVKTRIDGEELHKVECSVEGELMVDGEHLRIKRALTENWVKPRGQVEQVFKGNVTECWWNDVPVNVGEYARRVNEIVDASVFKMITSPTYFPTMEWKLQREQLVQIAGGDVTDAQILEEHPVFKELLDKISGQSLADFKKERAARKRRLKDELEHINPRIDQTRRLMPEADDYAAVERELADVEDMIAECDRQLVSLANERVANESARKETMDKLLDMDMAIKSVLYKARDAEQRRVYEENYNRNGARRQLDALKAKAERERKELDAMRTELDAIVPKETMVVAKCQKDVQRAERDIERKEAEIVSLRAKWAEENAREYAGGTKCPHCGQDLPIEMIDKAESLFYERQDAICDDISAKGKALSEEVKLLRDGIGKLTADRDARLAQFAAQREEIGNNIAFAEKEREATLEDVRSYEVTCAQIVEEQPNEIREEDLPECVEIRKQMDALRAATVGEDQAGKVIGINERRKVHGERRDALRRRLATRLAIAKGEEEIEALNARGRELAQQIADIEKEEYDLQCFTEVRNKEVEKRINSRFRIVTFQLYDYTIDGNPVECCIPLVNGVRYQSANTASQINAGLDIINTLVRHYDVSAPIFCENAESILDWTETASQMIFLRVADIDDLQVA